MSLIKISAVNYLNTRPFIYGLENSVIKKEIELSLDIPSICAEKLLDKRADIGLVPVAVLPELTEKYILSDYCLGADGVVDSVLLLSDVPLNEIKTIFLDYQSRTSVELVMVLADNYWNIYPEWLDAKENFELQIAGTTAGVVIGDRTFALKHKFRYCYDLATEWKKFTNLPFVFACWVTTKTLSDDFIACFNDALKLGIHQRDKVAELYAKTHHMPFAVVNDYLTTKIDFDFDAKKKSALNLFLSYIKEKAEDGIMKIV